MCEYVPVKNRLVEIGQKFGQLVTVDNPFWKLSKQTNKNGYIQKYQYVECKCSCGETRMCRVASLKSSLITKCKKCVQKEFIKKIQKGTPAKHGKKTCSICSENLDIKCFYPNKKTRDKLRIECKSCSLIRRIKNKFNIDVTYLRGKQIHCEICNKELFFTNDSLKKSDTLHIDHNHITNKTRGIVCTYCNCVIGYCKENIQTLENTIKYINKYN